MTLTPGLIIGLVLAGLVAASVIDAIAGGGGGGGTAAATAL